MVKFDDQLNMLKFMHKEERKETVINFGALFCRKVRFEFRGDERKDGGSKKVRY